MKAKSSCDGVDKCDNAVLRKLKSFYQLAVRREIIMQKYDILLNSVSNGKKVDFCGSQYLMNVKQLL